MDADIVEEVMVKHSATGLHILAAPSRPEYAEKVSSGQFSKVLEYLTHLYAYVIVDTSPTLTDVTLATIDVSDIIVLVTTQDIPSIKSCRLFLDLLNNLGINRSRVMFVMNHFDKKSNITPDRVADNLKQEVALTIPMDDGTAVKAVNRGIPFVVDNKNQPITRGVFALADGLRNRVAAEDELI